MAGVLEFLAGEEKLPPKLTVKRTTNRTQFFLVVRAYRQRLKRTAQFLTAPRDPPNAIRAILEEHSLLGDAGHFHVLEGVTQSFVRGLRPPPGKFILAETEEGELTPESVSQKTKRLGIKVIHRQLGVKNLTLRDTLKQDWLGTTSLEEVETILRRAKVMAWTEADLAEELKGPERVHTLEALKRGDFAPLIEAVARLGPSAWWTSLINTTAETIHYRMLRAGGTPEGKASHELDMSWYRAKTTEAALQVLTEDDLTKITEAIVETDPRVRHKPELIIPLFILNNPIRVRR
jgi:hypothetical protein